MIKGSVTKVHKESSTGGFEDFEIVKCPDGSIWMTDSPSFVFLTHCLTDLFTDLELGDPSSDVPELHKIHRSPDRVALKS